MINRVITGLAAILSGGLIACVPNFILTVSDSCQGMMIKCSWAAKTEFGIGVLIVFLGILLAFVESREIRIGVSAALGFVGILAALTATVLIGFCDGACSADCSCNPITAPLMAILGGVLSAVSWINVLYLSHRKDA